MSGKRKKRSPREDQQVAANLPDLNPDVGTRQELTRSGSPTSLGLLSNDTTNVSTLPERDDAPEQLASTTAAMADKYLLSKMEADFIPFLLLLIGCLAIAGIDNYQGRLNTGDSIQHLIWKCFTLSGFTLAVLTLYRLYRWISSKLP